ncbi:MAG: sigma 54-interacting transcriptional regulator [Firmicutes bacterium]|nr:sigma 54-interacting transcriptional regulator [Bacillota bacterium]
MGSKIVFIAPDCETAQSVIGIANELGLDVEVPVAIAEDRLTILRDCPKHGAEVVVSRWGYSLQAARAVSEVPIVNVEITGFDIARALQSARSMGGRLGIVHVEPILDGCAVLANIMGVDVAVFHRMDTDTTLDLERALARMIENQVDLILGGIAITSLARTRGIKGLRIRAGKEALSAALLEASRLIPVKQKERQQAERMKAILNSAYDGIIALDKKGIVTLFNPMAERITRLKASTVIGKSIGSVMPALGDSLARDPSESEVGVIRNVGGARVITNYVPIMVGDEISGAVINFLDIARIQDLEARARKDLVKRGLAAKATFSDIVFRSKVMLRTVEVAKRYSELDSPVLISGETGTGKELFAQSIHNASARASGPFVAVNCAAIPETLLESELFGYVEGAFTGARKQGKVGLFELAHRGTIFLDEVGEMPMSVQARFLRVVQEKEVTRIGDDKVIPVDVRIIAATNKDLEALVREGRFRDDLYYRLNVLALKIPPLRQRGKDDILACLEHFIKRCELQMGRTPGKLTDEDMKALETYEWRGNIREVENFVWRLAAMTGPDGSLSVSASTLLSGNSEEEHTGGSPSAARHIETLRDIEWRAIEDALSTFSGNKRLAAESLGISLTTLRRRLKEARVQGT